LYIGFTSQNLSQPRTPSIALSLPSHFLHHVPHASPRHAAHRFHADAADCRHAAPAHREDDEANSQRGAQRSHHLSTHPHPQEDSAGIDPPRHRSSRCHRSCRFFYCQEVLHRQDIAPFATTRKRVGGCDAGSWLREILAGEANVQIGGQLKQLKSTVPCPIPCATTPLNATTAQAPWVRPMLAWALRCPVLPALALDLEDL